jgi:hypothetical protein
MIPALDRASSGAADSGDGSARISANEEIG